MDVTLGNLRAQLLNARAWSAQGTTMEARLRNAIGLALLLLASEAEEAVYPDTERRVLLPDATSTTASARLFAPTSGDRWVLRFGVPTTGAALSTVPGGWTPTTDGTWDGVMHLEVRDPTGQWRRAPSREWWSSVEGPVTEYYVSLHQRWRNATDSDMEFRIHQPAIHLSDDIIGVLTPCRIWDSSRQKVWTISAGTARGYDRLDYRGNSNSRPTRLHREGRTAMPSPQTAPTVSQPEGLAWTGPEQKGTFRFCYTFVHGRLDSEGHESPAGITEPVWESAPSPISAAAVHPLATNPAFRIQCVNVDAMLSFDTTGAVAAGTRAGRSGYRIRLYVARDAVLSSGSGGLPTAQAFDNPEVASLFYLLDEFEPTSGSPKASYLWQGLPQPDYLRRLRWSTGYYAWTPTPHQDARYDLDLPVLRLPIDLTGSQDAVPVQQDSVPALFELALYYLSLFDGVAQADAAVHLERGMALLPGVRRRHANPGGVVENVPFTAVSPYLNLGTITEG
ncbi:MAG: hypothetical protein QME96_14795 [Myxococcota bacterium]|nr:hypothetical protein [Myxococcota bacterium]